MWPSTGILPTQYGHSDSIELDEKLLGLWDHIWFGVGSPGCSSSVSRLKSSFTVDPLDNVVPVVGYESLLPGVQANPLELPTSLQVTLPVLQQQVPTVIGQQQLLKAQQHQQQSTRLQYSAAHPASAAAIPAPSQPRPMWVPSGAAAASRAAAYAGSPTSPVQQQDRNGQQQPPQQQQQQQQEQDPRNPAPFVLGTWAQRQYILPVQRPVAQSSDSAGSPSSTGQHQAQTGSSSPARPIPRGKFPSSNGSSNSGGSTRAKAARDAMQHSSSGGSSEPPPASGAKQAAVEAAEAAAQAVDAGGNVGAAANGDDEAAFAMWQAAAAQADTVGARPSLGTDEEEEAVQQIAWRWRFARRWQAEQTRAPLDPAAPTSPGDGGMEEALQYLAACGENWQHLSRDSSRLGTVESRLLGTLGSMGCLGSELLADESFSAIGSGYGMQSTLLQDTADSTGPLAASCTADSREVSMTGDGSSSDGQAQTRQAPEQPAQQQPARQHRSGVQPRGEATVQVTGITKRAQELLEAQRNISRQAHERWQQVSSKQGSTMWVGALLEGVQVDPWGKFKFMLLRVKDRNGRQVLLVRGANNSNESKIVEELHKQMLAACSAHDLPTEAVDVLGGGIMEWTQHRDRHLHISNGYVSRAGGPGGPTTTGEVMRLAAVLTQQALPMHYKVTSDGDKQKL